ncbi:hypothetical protein Tco_0780861 [Tanacetum coccineum]
MARQCLKSKRKMDATWFRDKVILVESQGSGKVLNEEELEFLADPGVAEAKAVLMANLSSYGSDVLFEVPHSKNTHNDMLNQRVQEMPYSEQTHLVNYLENEITSDSNIIPYSQYLLETQNAAVQDTNSSTQQDAMILSVFEQLSNQIKLMLYDGSVIAKETNVISIADSEETLMLKEESRSKMHLKQNFGKCFVPQQELSDEQAFRLQTSHPNTDQSASSPIKIEAPRELPKMEAAVQQYFIDKQCFEIQKKQFLIENDRLLDQIISQDIMNIVLNSSYFAHIMVSLDIPGLSCNPEFIQKLRGNCRDRLDSKSCGNLAESAAVTT